MELNIREDVKIAEVWLTNQEQSDEILQSSLKPLYKRCKDAGYLVSVYCSGKENLYQHTLDLLCYNRKRQAQRDLKR